jgi:hypothetical protein
MLPSNHASDGTAGLCHEGAAELLIVTSPDLDTAVYMANDSSSSLMTRMRRIQKITRTCMKHHNETSH